MKISRRKALSVIAGARALLLSRKSFTQPSGVALEIASGLFKGTRESLKGWQVPDWYRDAVGIWAHWGPQSAIEYGDWYARNMYIQGHKQYEYHVKTYGHFASVGYKDVVPSVEGRQVRSGSSGGLYKRLERNISAAWPCTTTDSICGTQNISRAGIRLPRDRRGILSAPSKKPLKNIISALR